MSKIVLEVDDITAKIYHALNQEGKQHFSRLVSRMLKKATNDLTLDAYTKLLDAAGIGVIKNCLTPEPLKFLLVAD